MFNDRRAEERRRHDRQILQAFIVTMAGFWLTVFLLFMCILPMPAKESWPLLELPFSATGDKAPDKEYDIWIGVLANGEIFADGQRVTKAALLAALSQPRGDVFVRVDRAAPFRAVREVVRTAQRAHRRKLTFKVAVLRK